MKIIKPNKVSVGEINHQALRTLKTNASEAVQNLVRINPEHIQYVKTEHDAINLLQSHMHPFVEAVHLAYSDHLPLIISPDAIWYLISSGIANHINKNSEKLREKFVNHKGKETIKIRRDDFVLNSLNNPWHEIIDDFTSEIAKKTNNDVADLIMANFSNTTKVARVVSQIVLMDAMSKYFDYKFQTMCGIPEIRVTGEKEDWEKLKNKTEKLVELIPALKTWLNSGLSEILQNFVSVFDDKVDNGFWNQIYKGKYISILSCLIFILILFFII